MEVILKRNFFTPDGFTYKSKGPRTSVSIPDKFREKLPKGAVIVEEEVKEAPKKEEDPFAYRKESLEVIEADALAAIDKKADREKEAPKTRVTRKKMSVKEPE